jgi:cobalamin biosynthesis protein CobC
MLDHGGRLIQVSREYNIPLDRWTDLSTGINPCGWKVPPLDPSLWRRLPECDDELESAGRDYYGCESLLPVDGAQTAIQLLPKMRDKSTVGLLSLSYNEHAEAWGRAGHNLIFLKEDELESNLHRLEALVICNPNNPTGLKLSPEILINWTNQLASKGGWLIVDEAFVDTMPELSVSSQAGRPALIVLRSLGEFFGLAGARVGFVLAWQDLLDQLSKELGPWPVSTPARWIASLALRDARWQNNNRLILKKRANRLSALLAGHGLVKAGGSDLFAWVKHERAKEIATRLAQNAILVRCFSDPPSLRFGLPASEEEFTKLDRALASCNEIIAAVSAFVARPLPIPYA